jgi:hypothetical protein
MRELHMEGLPTGVRDLRELFSDPRARAAMKRAVTPGPAADGAGLAALDTSRVRLTFPCRMTVRLRSGRTIEIEGDEPGSSGRPLEEQRAVVARKSNLATSGSRRG